MLNCHLNEKKPLPVDVPCVPKMNPRDGPWIPSTSLALLPAKFLNEKIEVEPVFTSKNLEPAAKADSVMATLTPVNVTAALFQVCAKSSTGALAVSEPLLAESVVKAPVDAVVEPIADGAAKLMRALSKTPEVIALAA